MKSCSKAGAGVGRTCLDAWVYQGDPSASATSCQDGRREEGIDILGRVSSGQATPGGKVGGHDTWA